MDRDHDRNSCEAMIDAVRYAMGNEAFQKELEKREDLAEYIEYHGLE